MCKDKCCTAKKKLLAATMKTEYFCYPKHLTFCASLGYRQDIDRVAERERQNRLNPNTH